ncbi:MAG: hypothetical protein U5K31_04745 [Balneolaceae bacterium]|nr:hypothetical protein [Balneolaceae bacterium]
MKRLPALLLAILFIGCSTDSSDTLSQSALMDSLDVPQHVRQLDNLTVHDPGVPPQYEITFEETSSIDNVNSGRGGAFNIAKDPQGRIYVSDPAQTHIRAYDADFQQRGTLGREGKGPGEFARMGPLFVHGDLLMVYDFSLRRIQTFNTETMEDRRVINIDPQEFESFEEIRFPLIADFYSLGDQGILVKIPIQEKNDRNYDGYYLMNREGEITSEKIFETVQQVNHQFTVPNMGGMVGGVRLPFTDQGLVAQSPRSTVYKANTSEFLLTEINPADSSRRHIWYPYDNDPLTQQEGLDEFATSMHDIVREADFPSHWPALKAMMVDDQDRIWVATVTDDRENDVWWVLDRDGMLLGRFTWTKEETLQLVHDGHLYVSRFNQDDRVYSVDRYIVAMEPNNSSGS